MTLSLLIDELLGEGATVTLGATDEEEASIRDETVLTDIPLEDTPVIDEVELIETLEEVSVTDEIEPTETLKERSIITDEVEPMGTLEVASVIIDETGPVNSLLEETLLVIIGPIVAVLEEVWLNTLELLESTEELSIITLL